MRQAAHLLGVESAGAVDYREVGQSFAEPLLRTRERVRVAVVKLGGFLKPGVEDEAHGFATFRTHPDVAGECVDATTKASDVSHVWLHWLQLRPVHRGRRRLGEGSRGRHA